MFSTTVKNAIKANADGVDPLRNNIQECFSTKSLLLKAIQILKILVLLLMTALPDYSDVLPDRYE